MPPKGGITISEQIFHKYMLRQEWEPERYSPDRGGCWKSLPMAKGRAISLACAVNRFQKKTGQDTGYVALADSDNGVDWCLVIAKRRGGTSTSASLSEIGGKDLAPEELEGIISARAPTSAGGGVLRKSQDTLGPDIPRTNARPSPLQYPYEARGENSLHPALFAQATPWAMLEGYGLIEGHIANTAGIMDYPFLISPAGQIVGPLAPCDPTLDFILPGGISIAPRNLPNVLSFEQDSIPAGLLPPWLSLKGDLMLWLYVPSTGAQFPLKVTLALCTITQFDPQSGGFFIYAFPGEGFLALPEDPSLQEIRDFLSAHPALFTLHPEHLPPTAQAALALERSESERESQELRAAQQSRVSERQRKLLELEQELTAAEPDWGKVFPGKGLVKHLTPRAVHDQLAGELPLMIDSLRYLLPPSAHPFLPSASVVLDWAAPLEGYEEDKGGQ